jgi:hypothetical protein
MTADQALERYLTNEMRDIRVSLERRNYVIIGGDNESSDIATWKTRISRWRKVSPKKIHARRSSPDLVYATDEISRFR